MPRPQIGQHWLFPPFESRNPVCCKFPQSHLTFSDSVKHFCETMKTASVRDIRQNFPAIMRWIEEGENVAITMRRKIVARLVPERPPITRNAPAPDFDSISKRIFGAKKFRGNLADMEREGYDS